MTNRLQWDVFISSQIPAVTNDLPPGESEMKWSPISSTLISGKRDAVLVDTAITVEQKPEACGVDRGQREESDNDLRDPWPRRSFLRCKHNSKRISECAVRGNPRSDRGDAKAGFSSRCQRILEGPISPTNRFNARHCRRTQGRGYRTRRRATCECSLGHTDTDSTTCLHVPSIGLVVAGDSAYNDVHLHLGESNAETRKDWIAALDTIESLKPSGVCRGTQEARRSRYAEYHRRNAKIHSPTLTGPLPILTRRWNSTTRCLRFIPTV